MPLACRVNYSSRPAATCLRSGSTGTTAAFCRRGPEELEDGQDLNPEDGIIFVGDKGKMYVEGWGGSSPRLIPKTRMQSYQRPPKTLPRSIGHYKEWLAGVRNRLAHPVNFSFAGP